MAAANEWCDAAYPDPGQVDASLFDRDLHPVTSCWFRASATDLLGRVDGYLELLRRHDVSCHRLESDDPGRILYQDEYQIVVEPY